MSNIKLFESKKIRSVWNEEKKLWYFSVQDVVEALTESSDVKQYIKKMLSRDDMLKTNWGTICTPVEMLAADGKRRKIQAAEISKAAFGLTPKEYKEVKGLKSQNLRDHMTDLELIFSMLGEASTKEIAVNTDTQGFDENKKAARAGGKIAGDARKQLELKSGKSVVTGDNFLPENKRKELKNDND
ncbi:MAG: hypothetical protein EOM05_11315 [Clostridia bacterium]|nr:hypothetical protein [Clostridia bacterium]